MMVTGTPGVFWEMQITGSDWGWFHTGISVGRRQSILPEDHLGAPDSAARISTARLYGGAMGGWTGSRET